MAWIITLFACVEQINLHMEGHIVRISVPVVVGDVMNSAYRHDNLTSSVNDGQVDNGPGVERGQQQG